MTDNTLFQEVKEDLERQRLQALWTRHGKTLMGVLALFIVCTGVFQFYQSWKKGHDQRLTESYLESYAEENDTAKSLPLLQHFADTNSGSTEADFAWLRMGQLALMTNDTTKAVEYFNKVAGDKSADPAFRELGDLLAIRVMMDTGKPADLIARLQPLTGAHGPWRYAALELQAYLALRAGDKDQAKHILTDLAQDARVPHTIALRAGEVLRSID